MAMARTTNSFSPVSGISQHGDTDHSTFMVSLQPNPASQRLVGWLMGPEKQCGLVSEK
jgi:hypothetical protein